MRKALGTCVATILTSTALILIAPTFAGAKDKPVLPAFVRTAHTVAVIIDPTAGISLEDPRANQVAQKDVETALTNWGRYETVLSAHDADIIIVVRKGNKHLVDQTFPDPRQNSRPGVITPSDDGVSIGAQRGPQPTISGGVPTPRPTPGTAPSSTEVGTTEDSFAVYEGKVKDPLDGPAAWRFVAKDALKPHSVPAVDAFRKAVAEADKAAAAATHKP